MAELIVAQDVAERIYRRFAGNVARARRLASWVGAGAGSERDTGADVHRAAVVFLHAALEDLLRSVGRVWMPSATPDVLNAIPLLGMAGLGEERRFTLRHLAQHRGTSVDDLIYLSVGSYLDRKSFSSVEDILEFVRRLGIDTHRLPGDRARIARLIARRHRIVHVADLVGEQTAPAELTADELSEFREWADAVIDLGGGILVLSAADGIRPSVERVMAAVAAETA